MEQLSEQHKRTKMLIGGKGLEALAGARVAVFGIGGVGGSAAEALARAGIGAIDLIDRDMVEPSNINRQTVAFTDTDGQDRADRAGREGAGARDQQYGGREPA